MTTPTLDQLGPFLYEIACDPTLGMRTAARVVVDQVLLEQLRRDHSLAQLVNVTHLPGVWGPVFGMPDMHEGYGFPVGGVAATLLPDGVISPGGIGFDINCGVRLLASGLERRRIAPHTGALLHEISRSVPAGFGRGGQLALSRRQLDHVLDQGAAYGVAELGLGSPDDLDFIESRGCLPGADAGRVSERAKLRGEDQLGTLGGGNHFIEVQVVDEVFDPAAAARLGLRVDQVTVLLHTGSRGLGHQVCTDYARAMDASLASHRIVLPDRQLACAPLSSEEGGEYLAAMCAAANFGFVNRQAITQRVREVFARFAARLGPGTELRLIYDLAHNTAKLETHHGQALCVHRKGATRAFGPSSDELPAAYRGLGQPVLIPGSMGTASFVLLGTDAARDLSLASCCHGAGRALSRGAARRLVAGHELRAQLEAQGIAIACPSSSELAEEAPVAYKDVERVVDVVVGAGIARKIARLRPIGVVKG